MWSARRARRPRRRSRLKPPLPPPIDDFVRDLALGRQDAWAGAQCAVASPRTAVGTAVPPAGDAPVAPDTVGAEAAALVPASPSGPTSCASREGSPVSVLIGPDALPTFAEQLATAAVA